MLYGLQKGPEADALAAKGLPERMRLENLGVAFKDFADTAAAIENLDLVVSIDTAAAHLAGAMAKPTLVLLPFVPDWRWLLGRDDSPWYPTLRLFRQEKAGDWAAPMTAVGRWLSTISTNLQKAFAMGERVGLAAAADFYARQGRELEARIFRNRLAGLRSGGG
jgi:hypothetical protein